MSFCYQKIFQTALTIYWKKNHFIVDNTEEENKFETLWNH